MTAAVERVPDRNVGRFGVRAHLVNSVIVLMTKFTLPSKWPRPRYR